MDRVLILMVVLLLPACISSATRYVEECPQFCICDTWFNLRRATCTSQRLYSIHTGVSPRVQALDLSDNAISSLGDRELARTGLMKLKFLNLSSNGISRIDMDGFYKLNELAVLDLSRNHLDYLNDDTFLDNPQLRILRLNGNKFTLRVPKLSSFSITELSLSSCRINHVPPNTFDGLPQLRKLDLSHNYLIELSLNIVKRLSSLETISLQYNMWNCHGSNADPAIRGLQAYFRKKKIEYTLCNVGDPNLEKFQKMVDTSPKSRMKVFTDSIRDAWESSDVADPSPLDFDNATNTQNTFSTSFSSTLAETFGNVPYYWYLLIGILLGSGATMIVTYVWLSTTIACIVPRLRRRTRVVSQRAALLQHLLSHDGNAEETTEQSLSCPGTPPPPYREVMLHRGLYPRVHTTGRPVATESSTA